MNRCAIAANPYARNQQTVPRQIDGSGREIVDRFESSFTEHVVIDDAEILEVSITIAQCTIQHDQRESIFSIREYGG